MTIVFDEFGLTVPTQQERRDRLAARLQSRFGTNLKIESTSIMGQIIDEVTELLADDDQALLALFVSIDPDGANGVPLDQRAALTGTVRNGATNSFVNGVLTFSAAGTMNNGDLIRNEDNGSLWELTDGPHAAAGPFPEEIAAQFTAVETGPILANAGTTWSLVTSVTGLDSFENATDDADPGRDQEEDPDLRTRRLVELFARGQGPLVAIRGAVSQVDGVVYARVWHNPTEQPVDADGIKFKAFRVVVETLPSTPTAGQQQAIWDAIWTAMGAGGEAWGTDYVGSTIDSEGTEQPVAFDTVDVKDIVVEVDLVTTGTEEPITPNIEDVVAARILSRANEDLEKVARDVKRIDIQGIVYDMLTSGEITGPYAVNVRMAIDPGSPASVDRLVMGQTDKPDFDSANITVAIV